MGTCKVKEDLIPKYWHSNTKAKSKAGSFHTDGINLYSGKKLIGTTDDHGQKILYNYTKTQEGIFLSALISRHVNLAKFYADDFVRMKNNDEK